MQHLPRCGAMFEGVEEELHAGLDVEFLQKGAAGANRPEDGGKHVGEGAVAGGGRKMFFKMEEGIALLVGGSKADLGDFFTQWSQGGIFILGFGKEGERGLWVRFHREDAELHAMDALQDEVRGGVFVCDCGTDDAEAPNVGDRAIIGGVGDGKHAVAREGELAHEPVAFFKNMERQHRARK